MRLRDRIDRYKPVITPARVVALDNTNRGVTVLSTRLEHASLDPRRHMTRIHGAYVQADKANSNGAFWSAGDLQFGTPSVAGGPINWLHEELKVLGAIERASLQGDSVRIDGVLWNWLYPKEVTELREYADAGTAWFSMECVSEQVECVGPEGCGRIMSYRDAQLRTGEACDHVKERASHRRFINPVFMGAAVIVPPTRPGWANAHLDLVRDAQPLAEAAHLEENTAAKLLEYAQRP